MAAIPQLFRSAFSVAIKCKIIAKHLFFYENKESARKEL
jgi:hypothetical protein